MSAPVLEARVLIVDDDQQFTKAIKPQLETHFQEVELAASEEEGWALLEKDCYDLVLLDLILGEEPTGMGMCRRLKSAERWRDMPVLIVTMADVLYGMSLKSLLADGNCLPADDFADKGLEPSEIVKRARRIVERSVQR